MPLNRSDSSVLTVCFMVLSSALRIFFFVPEMCISFTSYIIQIVSIYLAWILQPFHFRLLPQIWWFWEFFANPLFILPSVEMMLLCLINLCHCTGIIRINISVLTVCFKLLNYALRIFPPFFFVLEMFVIFTSCIIQIASFYLAWIMQQLQFRLIPTIWWFWAFSRHSVIYTF